MKLSSITIILLAKLCTARANITSTLPTKTNTTTNKLSKIGNLRFSVPIESYYTFLSTGESAQNRTLDYKCIGSFLTHNFMITSAYCVEPTKIYHSSIYYIQSIKIYVTENETEIVNPRQIISHPCFEDRENLSDSSYDIALVKIEDQLVNLTKHVQILNLPNKEAEKKLYAGEDAYMAAIGRKLMSTKNNTKNNSNELRKVEQVVVKIVSNTDQQCTNFSKDLAYIRYICAIPEQERICNGQNGGPLFYSDNQTNWTLIGIRMYVIPKDMACNDTKIPEKILRVNLHLDWIMHVISPQDINNYCGYFLFDNYMVTDEYSTIPPEITTRDFLSSASICYLNAALFGLVVLNTFRIIE